MIENGHVRTKNTQHDRDHNAAINIKRQGLNILSGSGTE